MDNRTVGILIISIALMIGFVIYSFNAALSEIVNQSCSHGPSCPMWGTIDFQTNVGLAIMALILLLGLYLIFFGDSHKDAVKAAEKAVTTVLTPSPVDKLKSLPGDEARIFSILIDSKGSILQSNLVQKVGLTKVQVTRLLDKLEGKGLIERQRRGMTNIVLLKH